MWEEKLWLAAKKGRSTSAAGLRNTARHCNSARNRCASLPHYSSIPPHRSFVQNTHVPHVHDPTTLISSSLTQQKREQLRTRVIVAPWPSSSTPHPPHLSKLHNPQTPVYAKKRALSIHHAAARLDPERRAQSHPGEEGDSVTELRRDRKRTCTIRG